MPTRHLTPTLFPYTTLFRSHRNSPFLAEVVTVLRIEDRRRRIDTACFSARARARRLARVRRLAARLSEAERPEERSENIANSRLCQGMAATMVRRASITCCQYSSHA